MKVGGDKEISLSIAKNCITGKIYNARWVLERAVRDHSLQINTDQVKNSIGSSETITGIYKKQPIKGTVERI